MTHVTFKDRKTAEQFMFGVSANKSIPGVDGTVELSWSNLSPKVADTDGDLSATNNANNVEDEQTSKQAVEVEESGGFGACLW